MKITEKQLALISTACTCLLLFIWVLPNTIALRHVLLGFGALSGIALIRANWHYFNFHSLKLAPLCLILTLFFWVLIHYLFFSLNREMELSEIKGIWLRTFLGFLMAIGLAVSLHKYSNLKRYFFVAVFFVPFINIAAYGYDSYLHGALIKPNDFVFFLFAKIETAFFGAIAGAVAVGNLFYLLLVKTEKTETLKIFYWLLGLALVLISDLVSSTKNGIAIALGLCALLVIIFVVHFLRHRNGSKLASSVALVILLAMSYGIWEGHKTVAYRGWETVFEDAALGLDIDSNKQWQKGEGTVPAPLNSTGSQAAMNTYTRFAYAAVGTRLISKYPTGYGSINNSFWGLLDVAGIPHEYQRQAHSGWIDFGMAFGIPGLMLVFTSILLILVFAFMNPTLLNLCSGIICLTLLSFGVIAEISYKQYFEATILFIALSAMIIAIEIPQTRKIPS